MALKISSVKRTFKYNSITLPDPGEKLSPEAVRDLYAANYPELATAEIEGPETVGNSLQYKFVKSVGTKG